MALLTSLMLLMLFEPGALQLAHASAKKPPSTSPPVCFLSGEVRKAERSSDTFTTLGNSIRLRFEANFLDECKAQFEVWCKKDVLANHYKVGRLNGYFDHKGERTEYTLSQDCAVERHYQP